MEYLNLETGSLNLRILGGKLSRYFVPRRETRVFNQFQLGMFVQEGNLTNPYLIFNFGIITLCYWHGY